MITAIGATIFSSKRNGNNGTSYSLLPKREKREASVFSEVSDSQLSVVDMARIISQLDLKK